MQKRYVIGNWKLNPLTLKGAQSIISGITSVKAKGVTTVLCPPAVFLGELHTNYKGKTFSFGAQDVFWENSGAYTGALSAPMLEDRGARYVIVGHSERRALGETNEIVSRKVVATLKADLTAILCVGEPTRDREGVYLEFLQNQIAASLKGVTRKQLPGLIIAYEPIWAIGLSGEKAMKPDDLHETSLYIRKVISDLYKKEDAHRIPILYGGSVESENAGTLVTEGKVQGVLVGHQSLKPKEFVQIIDAVSKA